MTRHAGPNAGLNVEALATFLTAEAHAHSVEIRHAKRLTGGAVQENWLVEASFRGGPLGGGPDDPPQRFVLRKDAPTTLTASLSRVEEYHVIKAVHELGVRVPAPIALCEDPEILGGPFAMTRFVEGTARGDRLVKDGFFSGDRAALARSLAEELAVIHTARQPYPGLEGLPAPTPFSSPTHTRLALLEGYLDELPAARPTLEWALRWLRHNAPRHDDEDTTLVHGDFRTGNFLVDAEGLTAVLDWEFARFGNPMEDLGSLRAACWRFGREDRQLGGIADWAPFADVYAVKTGRRATDEALRYFEIMEHLRWAILVCLQAERHIAGKESSLELALTGRQLPELEYALLDLTQRPVDPDAFLWQETADV